MPLEGRVEVIETGEVQVQKYYTIKGGDLYMDASTTKTGVQNTGTVSGFTNTVQFNNIHLGNNKYFDGGGTNGAGLSVIL